MKLPQIQDPTRYRGLFVYDFGDWTAVGYTAEEVAMLLEDPRYRDGKVYRVHRATPDGKIELKGVSAERFQLESAMLFWRDDLAAAREDYEQLVRSLNDTPPPSRGFVHLAESLADGQAGRFVNAIVYPSEFDDDMAQWLLDIEYRGGDTVEGGISMATGYYQLDRRVIDRHQFFSARAIAARSAEDVFENVRKALQR